MTQSGHHSFVLIIGINVCKVAIAGTGVSVSPVRASEFEALIYANFKHPFIEYIAMSALRRDLSLAQQKAGDTFGDLSQAHPGMAGGSPQYHLGWLGHCLGDCTGASLLASTLGMIGIRAKRRASPRAVGSPQGSRSAKLQVARPLVRQEHRHSHGFHDRACNTTQDELADAAVVIAAHDHHLRAEVGRL
jgi:hypothetical protein